MCGCDRDSVDVCSQTEVIAHGALESGVGEFFYSYAPLHELSLFFIIFIKLQ